MTTFIYKPGTTKGPVVLIPSEESGVPTITLSNGQVVQGKFLNDNEGRKQYVFPPGIISDPKLTLSVNGKTQVLGAGGQAFEGSGVGSLQPRGKGSVGAGGVGAGGAPFGATAVGGGFSPQYLGGQIPQFNPVTFQPATYDPIKTPNYNLEDPASYGAQYGDFARTDYLQNFGLSDNLALSTLNTELKGLRSYAPAAAALQRTEIAKDNNFNQLERTAQVDQGLPGARQDLAAQEGRANTFAQGKLGSAIDDRAFELGLRSNAADIARTRGFGDDSVVAATVSDKLSAAERFKVSQYGDQLLSQNVTQRQNLELAPTEYSQAGSAIPVIPSVSASQLTSSYTNALTERTGISATNAIQSSIQQNQFKTTLDYNTAQFNAGSKLQNSQFNSSNQLQADQFNSTNEYAAALNGFTYNTGFAQGVADNLTAGKNQERQDEQQKTILDAYNKAKGDSQKTNTVSGILSLVGTIVGAVYGGPGGAVAGSKIGGQLGGGTGGGGSAQATGAGLLGTIAGLLFGGQSSGGDSTFDLSKYLGDASTPASPGNTTGLNLSDADINAFISQFGFDPSSLGLHL